jgi:hypothetical protein
MLVMVLIMLLRVARSRFKIQGPAISVCSAWSRWTRLDSHQEAAAGVVVVVSRFFNGAQSNGYLEAICEVS